MSKRKPLPEIRAVPGFKRPKIRCIQDSSQDRFEFQVHLYYDCDGYGNRHALVMSGPKRGTERGAIKAWNSLIDRIVKHAKESA